MPEKNLEPMTLGDIEFSLLERLDYLEKKKAERFEIPPMESWLRCYEVLAQIKQAQAQWELAKHLDRLADSVHRLADNSIESPDIAGPLESIAKQLDGFRMHGFPVENVH